MKGAGAGNYYLDLARDDYYANAREQAGVWFGRGAELLGLAGLVHREPFLHLLSGCSPDGKSPLVQNARAPDRQSGWDLTFSAPKSVSVLWALASPRTRQQIEMVHHQAVELALSHLERTSALTRRGQGGKIVEPAAVVFATFQHSTSRAQDPQLHTHAIVVNLGLRRDGTTGTLQSHAFFEQKMLLGSLYRAQLAAGLSKHLGLILQPEPVGFHVAGVPRELCHELSKRRRDIKRVLEERGQTDAVAAKVATLDTRPRKQRTSRAELFAQWQAVGKSFGWEAAQAAQLIRDQAPRQVNRVQFEHDLQTRIEALPEAKWTPARIVRAGAHEAVRHGVDAHALLEGLDRVVERRSSHLPQLFHVEWRRLFDDVPWVPGRGRFLYTEKFHPFPDAAWGPARRFALRRAVVELPRLGLGAQKAFRPKWWRIYWKRDLPIGELRLQERILFPKAPKWSPVHGLSVRALHLTTHKSKWQPAIEDDLRDHKRSQGLDQGHSH